MSINTLRRQLSVTSLGCLLPAAGSRAQAIQLTLSTNNTARDRRILELVSQEAARRLGWTLSIVSLPSERSLVAANLGEVDGEGLRVAGLEAQYPNLLRVPERFTSVSFTAFSADPAVTLERGFDSLASLRVAFIKGWKLYESRVPSALALHRVDGPEQMFRMLADKRIDVALYTLIDGQRVASSLGMAQIRPILPALAEQDMFVYLHRRHAAQVPQLAQAVHAMKADGSLARMVAAARTE
jgi:polar amino acid transport system substrate-binding protein